MAPCLIAGSRNIAIYNILLEAIQASRFIVSEVISGCARGVDKLGECYAAKMDIPIRKFPADWKKFGKKAGLIRNIAMLDYIKKHSGNALFVWDGQSTGTRHCIHAARKTFLEESQIFIFYLRDSFYV